MNMTAQNQGRDEMMAVTRMLTNTEFKSKIQQALPDGVSADRFTRVTLTAIQQNPGILKTDRNSLYNSVIRCAQDGLNPDGKEAALVDFGGKCQYMPMIGGLRKIAAKYGIRFATGVVHENDLFEYELGVDPVKRHIPPKLGTDRGEIIGVWAEGVDADGGTFLEVMDRADVEKIRNISRSKSSGPWVQHWGEMARKTVGRRLFKSLPLYDLDERDASVLQSIDDDFVADVPAAPAAATTGSTVRPSVLDRVKSSVASQDDEAPADDPPPATDQPEEIF